jgi:hypothetical protein
VIYKYAFKSSTGSATYTARLDTETGDLSCNCKGWTFKRYAAIRGCKHTTEVTAKMEQKHNCSAPKGVACSWCGAVPFLGKDAAGQLVEVVRRRWIGRRQKKVATKSDMPTASVTIGGKKVVEPILRVNGLWKVGGKLYATKDAAEHGFVNQKIAEDETAKKKAAALHAAEAAAKASGKTLGADQIAKLAAAMAEVSKKAGISADAFDALGFALGKVPVMTGALKASAKNPILMVPASSVITLPLTPKGKAPVNASAPLPPKPTSDVVSLRRKRRIDLDD